MEYPKQIMKVSELKEMGFPEKFLMIAYLTKGQTFAQKLNTVKKNSPIIFDTEGFEKWRLNRLAAENKALPR